MSAFSAWYGGRLLIRMFCWRLLCILVACSVCVDPALMICQLLSCRYGNFALTQKGCNISDRQVVTSAENFVV